MSASCHANSLTEATDGRPYKISILIFKHLPQEKNTQTRLINRWSEKKFIGSTYITTLNNDLSQPYLSTEKNSTYDILLPTQQSALASAYRALRHDPNYIILFNGAWVTHFQTGIPRVFHFYQLFDTDNSLNSLVQITLKFYFDIHFQAQLLSPRFTKDFSTYQITTLDEFYQAPSNQLQYIDSPNYGALVLITHYDAKEVSITP